MCYECLERRRRGSNKFLKLGFRLGFEALFGVVLGVFRGEVCEFSVWSFEESVGGFRSVLFTVFSLFLFSEITVMKCRSFGCFFTLNV